MITLVQLRREVHAKTTDDLSRDLSEYGVGLGDFVAAKDEAAAQTVAFIAHEMMDAPASSVTNQIVKSVTEATDLGFIQGFMLGVAWARSAR